MKMLTIIESPYAGDIERNKLYLGRAVRHSISIREVPFASHGFYTQFLDDTIPSEHQHGIELGYAFWEFASRIAFYTDYSLSDGMLKALDEAILLGKPYEMRRIGTNDGDKYD